MTDALRASGYLDYPTIRAGHTCPLCLQPKDDGLLVCWSCFPLIRDGASPVHTAIFDTIERGGGPATVFPLTTAKHARGASNAVLRGASRR